MKLSVVFAGAVFATEEPLGAENATQELLEIELIKDDTCYSNNIEVPCWLTLKNGMGNSASGTEAELTANRYNDLDAMFTKVWAKNGMRGKKYGFKVSKIWPWFVSSPFAFGNTNFDLIPLILLFGSKKSRLL